jgi:lysophosphatidic acid acyltransferase/lysophosphatidylinositol acyltransferase
MKIAQEKGLPELKHHILPRTKGFILLLQGADNRSKLLSYKIHSLQ